MNSTDCKLNPEADWATIRQLRADLATVTAERDLLETQKAAIARRVLELEDIKPLLDGAELAETRKALEYACLFPVHAERKAELEALESTRAELAKALENCGRYKSAYAYIKKELKGQKQLAAAAVLEANESERETAETRKELEELRAKYDTDLSNAEVAHQLELAKAEAKIAAVRKVTAWSPCPAEPEADDDGPLFQGFITDLGGTWVKVEDLVEALRG